MANKDGNFSPRAIPFPLNIKTDDGKMLLTSVTRMDTIENVKRQIEEKFGISFEQQRLFYDGKELQNHQTLFSCKIASINTLYLIRRPGAYMSITIKTPMGKIFPLHILVNDTVENIKSKIQEKENVPINEQRLLFAGKQLEDHRTLSHYKIMKASMIYLLHRFPERIQILIETPTERTITLDVDSTDTVNKVKQMVCNQERISMEEHRLSSLFQGFSNEEMTLAYYNVVYGSVLYLTLQTRPELTASDENNTVTTIALVNDQIERINCVYRISDVTTTPDTMLLPIDGYERQPLVSLDEAIAPLVPIIANIAGKIQIAKKRAASPADGLTSDESAAIILYTMEWPRHEESLYFILNSILRSEDRDSLKPWFLYLKLILTGLNKLPSIPGRTYFRGVKRNLSDVYLPGDNNVVWWAFSSCTSNITALQKEQFLGKKGVRTLFAIECQNGKDICRHSMYPKESEILLMPATHLEVIGQYQSSADEYMIQMREIVPIDSLQHTV